MASALLLRPAYIHVHMCPCTLLATSLPLNCPSTLASPENVRPPGRSFLQLDHVPAQAVPCVVDGCGVCTPSPSAGYLHRGRRCLLAWLWFEELPGQSVCQPARYAVSPPLRVVCKQGLVSGQRSYREDSAVSQRPFILTCQKTGQRSNRPGERSAQGLVPQPAMLTASACACSTAHPPQAAQTLMHTYIHMHTYLRVSISTYIHTSSVARLIHPSIHPSIPLSTHSIHL
ncbi:uncharacterized protein J3D65DRAFT_428807 [Phyllosticta citribraziliensis]|uniref:Uncharacterized protein n=1 Tax=Phyllosticta citribraziliensis TaxID=989973 RepID=A0ABR1LI99_9PEZI